VVLGVQVHVPSVFAQGVEEGFSPNWPPGLTEELTGAGEAMLVLAVWEGLATIGVTVLAGALDLGDAGGAALDGAGAGAWLEGAGATVEAGVELSLGAAVVEGSGLTSLFCLTGMMFFMIIRRD
jgi:hypothetical protein